MLTLIFLMLFALAACGDTSVQPSESDMPEILKQAQASAAPTPEASDAPAVQTDLSSDDADIDLTQLSSTVVYSEVFNMVNTPENYEGETVKMQGSFAVYEDEASGKVYYACIIQDATACCAQGIEFVPDESLRYPDDFPALGTEITVIGTFGTYYEGDQMYVTLFDAEMSV